MITSLITPIVSAFHAPMNGAAAIGAAFIGIVIAFVLYHLLWSMANGDRVWRFSRRTSK